MSRDLTRCSPRPRGRTALAAVLATVLVAAAPAPEERLRRQPKVLTPDEFQVAVVKGRLPALKFNAERPPTAVLALGDAAEGTRPRHPFKD